MQLPRGLAAVIEEFFLLSHWETGKAKRMTTLKPEHGFSNFAFSLRVHKESDFYCNFTSFEFGRGIFFWRYLWKLL